MLNGALFFGGRCWRWCEFLMHWTFWWWYGVLKVIRMIMRWCDFSGDWFCYSGGNRFSRWHCISHSEIEKYILFSFKISHCSMEASHSFTLQTHTHTQNSRSQLYNEGHVFSQNTPHTGFETLSMFRLHLANRIGKSNLQSLTWCSIAPSEFNSVCNVIQCPSSENSKSTHTQNIWDCRRFRQMCAKFQ